MQSKTSQIETYLLNAIERGEYPPGLPIPTRHQMTQMFHCSRTIVERAIAALSADGHLESGRGRRTVVRKAVHPGSGIKRLHVISQHDCHRSLSDVFCSFVADQDYFGIPVRWIPPEKAGIMASELCRPESALIWMLPRYEDLELLNFLKARKIPILLHTGDKRFDFSNPNRLLPVLRDFPGLTVIGAHFGGYSIWQEAAAQLHGIPNFYVDCSSTMFALPDAEVVELIRLYGADRVMFGTDYPMWSPVVELAHFQRLPLTQEERALILHKNAEAIFGIA